MKKTWIVLLILLCLTLAVPVSAQPWLELATPGNAPCVVDEADLLTASEEAQLTEKLESIRQEYQVDMAVVTVSTTQGYSWEGYANGCYDGLNYGMGADRDGVLLLISMEPGNRGWYILTNGLGYDAIDSGDVEDIGEKITPDLKSGDYLDAFTTFAREAEHYIDIEINGEPFRPVSTLLISLAIGLVVALIATGIMRGKLKSVHYKAGASDYVKSGSLKITESRDFFLYSRVDRREKPKSSSSGGRSGGGGSRRGGGGGSF